MTVNFLDAGVLDRKKVKNHWLFNIIDNMHIILCKIIGIQRCSSSS